MMLNIEALSQYLGVPISRMLTNTPFKTWEYERTFQYDINIPRIDYVFLESAIDVICDTDETTRAIFISLSGKRGIAKDIIAPLETWTRRDVVNYFGPPSKSGGLVNDPILGDLGSWDRFARHNYSIHIEYSVDEDKISKITLMRLDAIP